MSFRIVLFKKFFENLFIPRPRVLWWVNYIRWEHLYKIETIFIPVLKISKLCPRLQEEDPGIEPRAIHSEDTFFTTSSHCFLGVTPELKYSLESFINDSHWIKCEIFDQLKCSKSEGLTTFHSCEESSIVLATHCIWILGPIWQITMFESFHIKRSSEYDSSTLASSTNMVLPWT